MSEHIRGTTKKIDCVSRQDAIEALRYAELGCELEAIEALPSAQPKATDLISKQSAIVQTSKVIHDDAVAHDVKEVLKTLPSAQPTLTNAESNTELSVDLISRADALSCFHDWIDQRGDVHTADEMPEYQRIEQLPPAQPERRPYHEEWVSALQTLPEIIRCKDCKHQTVFHYTDKRFKDPDRYVYGCDLMPDGCYLNCFDSYCSEAERRTDG